MHPQNGWLAPLGAFALPALQQSFWIASSIQRSGQRAQCNKQTNICNNHPYFANILHYYMVECPHLPMNKSISVTFQSNSPQSTHNITLLPFQVEECGFGEDIWAKKGLPACGQLWQSVPKTEPPLLDRLLCMPTRPPPLLWIIIMRSPRPKSRTFWSCIGEQEEERGVSGLHLAFGSMDNLPFAHWQCWHCHEKQIRHGKGCFEF